MHHGRKEMQSATGCWMLAHLDSMQAQIQSLYTKGLLCDVPARLLNARPSPPVRRSECAVWIDLAKK